MGLNRPSNVDCAAFRFNQIIYRWWSRYGGNEFQSQTWLFRKKASKYKKHLLCFSRVSCYLYLYLCLGFQEHSSRHSVKFISALQSVRGMVTSPTSGLVSQTIQTSLHFSFLTPPPVSHCHSQSDAMSRWRKYGWEVNKPRWLLPLIWGGRLIVLVAWWSAEVSDYLHSCPSLGTGWSERPDDRRSDTSACLMMLSIRLTCPYHQGGGIEDVILSSCHPLDHWPLALSSGWLGLTPPVYLLWNKLITFYVGAVEMDK